MMRNDEEAVMVMTEDELAALAFEAIEAQEAVTRLLAERSAASARRRDRVTRLRDGGMPYKDIAALLGITASRVSQIISGYQAP
jgi:hypothetical protein